MEISVLTQQIIELAPAITAIIGIIVSLVVGIKKIKNANKDAINELIKANEETVNSVKQTNEDLIKANEEIISANLDLQAQNAQLKREMHALMAELKNVHTKE